MAKDKNSFVLYANYIDVVNALTNEQAGILFKHIMEYVNDKEPLEPVDPIIKIAWLGIKSALKADLKRYEKKCEQNRANVNKRYNKTTDEYERMQSNTNVYEENGRRVSYYDIDIDNDIDIDIDNDIDNKITKEDNIEKEKKERTRNLDTINELMEIIKENFSLELSDNDIETLNTYFDNLLSKYTESNVRISTYHALNKTLTKEILDNPIGYLWNAIAINCEQFKLKKIKESDNKWQ